MSKTDKKENYKFAIDWVEEERQHLIGYLNPGADVKSIQRELESIPIDSPVIDKKNIATLTVSIVLYPSFNKADWMQDKLKALYPRAKVAYVMREDAKIPRPTIVMEFEENQPSY